MKKGLLSALLTAVILATGCAGSTGAASDASQPEQQAESQEAAEAEAAESGDTTLASDTAESGDKSLASDTTQGRIRGQDASTADPIESQNGNIVILYTNDVHCAVDTNIGYAGFYAYKKAMEEEGNAVFVVDDGDAIQGGTFGSMTKGEAIIHLMNDVGYDLAIPGNHEFDYGVPRFLELTQMADYPYICCNFEDLRTGDLVFDSYVIREIGGIKYQLIDQGDGNTLFDGAEVVDIGRYIEDVDAIAEYLSTFGGIVPEQYADRYGQERIHFISE